LAISFLTWRCTYEAKGLARKDLTFMVLTLWESKDKLIAGLKALNYG
jgi:hypothetical protein